MTIITECPTCDSPQMVSLARNLTGTWMPHICGLCRETMVIEQTRMDGKTYDEETFVAEVLPDLEGIERVDHPSGEAHIYADPETIQFREVDQ